LFIDFLEAAAPTELDADICIVGAGAAGIAMARTFIGSALRVCLLESGGPDGELRNQALYEADSIGSPPFGAELAHACGGRFEAEPWLADADGTPQVRGTAHHLGTTRMADDPRHGVVDRDCRVHGMANLHVAGSSVFPTGGWAFPTFTIVALSLRLADRLQMLCAL
jgi:Choline dehydrogenase and related flavoproteins